MVEVDDDGRGAARSAAPARPGLGAAGLVTVAGTYVTLLLVLLWSRSLQTPYLAAAGFGIIAAVVVAWPGWRSAGSRLLLLGSVGVVGLTLGLGAFMAWRLHALSEHWPEMSAAHQERLTTLLEQRMATLVLRGERVAERAAEVAREGDASTLFVRLEELRRRGDVAALMLLDERGEPVVWAGDHRGKVSRPARREAGSVHYLDRPLVSYLYFRVPVGDGRRQALAALQIRTGWNELGLESDAFADRFEQSTGVRPIFIPGPSADADWILERDGGVVLSAVLPLASQVQWRTELARTARRLVLALGLVALILLSATWLRAYRRSRAAPVPLAALGLALLVAPIGSILGLEGWLSPALFVAPGPVYMGLPSLLGFLLPVGAFIASTRPPTMRRWTFRLAVGLGSLALGLGFMVTSALFIGSAANPLRQGGFRFWFVLQPAALLVMTMLATLLMPRRARARRSRWGYAVLGGAICLLLAGLLLWRWRSVQLVDHRLLGLWAVPFAFAAVFVASYRGRADRLVRWTAAGWLAATALVPQLWISSIEARLRAADVELATLGEWTEPFLAYLLQQFADELTVQHRRGERGADMLYMAWVNSGLARESYPLHLTLWDRTDTAALHLPLGGGEIERPREAADHLRPLLDRARAAGTVLEQAVSGVPGVTRALVVPLSDGTTVSAEVSPRRSLDRRFPLATFLGSAHTADTRLELVPVTEPQPPGQRRIRWEPTEEGWRSETVVRYPTESYHAHMHLRLPPVIVRVARGVLILAADLGLLLLVWAVGRAVRGDPPAPAGGWVRWLGTFRARVTLALFFFFLIPTVVFGWIAYQALAGEIARSARTVAERAVRQATELFPQLELAEISARTGEELLYYQRGELLAAASPEALELGLYSAWMPPDAYLTLETGEDFSVTQTRELGGRPYIAAFARLRPAGSLGVPIWLSVGDVPIRQQELAHLILFSALVGGVLSFILSVLVGRTLARPIGELRQAAAAVGRGELSGRLPRGRTDEFGDLFSSFDRMTRRLRRARAREVHTARVLAWGEMARQVAHEIKNPLTPIKLAVQHIRRAYKDRRPDYDDILDANVEQILKEIDRLTDIARAFSRYGAPAEAAGPLERVDVVGVVEDAITLYRAGDTAVEYRMSAEPDVPPALARSAELKEVMVNLLENARAAATGAGSITASVGRFDGTVEVAVADDGEGIPPEQLPNVFEPRFSTRSAGTGLGLAIVRRLVEGWGGSVTAESEARRGTTVRIRIPVYQEP